MSDFEPYAGIYSGDAIADRTRGEVLALRAEVKRLRAFVQKVALFSNDSWLAQEADQIAPGAELKP